MKNNFIKDFSRREIQNDKFLRTIFEEFAKRQAEENFVELLDAAKEVGLTKISLNEMEIIDPDKNKDEENIWPAIWQVARKCNFNCCGNSNQSQIYTGYFLPKYFGTWDIEKQRKIGKAESLFGKILGTDEEIDLETMNGESGRS